LKYILGDIGQFISQEPNVSGYFQQNNDRILQGAWIDKDK